MEHRTLGRTGLLVSPVGFGAWAIGGGDYAFGWGAQDDRDSVAAVERAVDLGINWIDTAPVYGLGHSEEVIGRALRQLGSSRRPYVFTKCSLVWKEGRREVSHSLDAGSIRREAEASLKRLGVEAIDLLQIHWPGWPPPASSPQVEEGWAALAALKKAGTVRHVGVSNFGVADLERAERVAPVESLQPPYSLLRRRVEAEILPWCRAHDAGVIVYSPMQAGLLSGKMTRERIAALPADDWRRGSPEFQEPRFSQNMRLVGTLRAVGERHGRRPGEVAVAWVLRHPAVTAAIVGFRRPQQVEEIVGAGGLRLTDAEAAEIEAAIPAR
jgi:aryl-alcohol dehydrogenase-like predicted oxidoreductase